MPDILLAASTCIPVLAYFLLMEEVFIFLWAFDFN
jgi:hypothetical protein